MLRLMCALWNAVAMPAENPAIPCSYSKHDACCNVIGTMHDLPYCGMLNKSVAVVQMCKLSMADALMHSAVDECDTGTQGMHLGVMLHWATT